MSGLITVLLLTTDYSIIVKVTVQYYNIIVTTDYSIIVKVF